MRDSTMPMEQIPKGMQPFRFLADWKPLQRLLALFSCWSVSWRTLDSHYESAPCKLFRPQRANAAYASA